MRNHAREALSAVRDRVGAFGPPHLHDDVAVGWNQLLTWAQERSLGLSVEVATLTARSNEADAAADSAKAALERAEDDLERASSEQRPRRLPGRRPKAHSTPLRNTPRSSTTLLSGSASEEQAGEELARVRALDSELASLIDRLTEARNAASTARDALTEVQSTIAEGWRLLHDVRDPLAQFGAPRVAGQDLAAEWDTLVSWATARAQDHSARIETQQGVAEQAVLDRDRLAHALADDLTRHGIPSAEYRTAADMADRAPSAVAAAVATARSALARARERRNQRIRLTTEMAAAQESARIAHTLSTLMRANNFPRWLIGGALDTLLRSASAILLELSGGQFELTRTDSDLLVIDHHDADMRRIVKTLSGGETFQASLALALALSEEVTALSAAGASRLDSIFLDEGFGTLDATTLDVVAGTLENLASSGSRMVGVITHVAALAERIPVQFRISRDSAGSHLERVAG